MLSSSTMSTVESKTMSPSVSNQSNPTASRSEMLPLDSVNGAKDVFVRSAEAGERVRLFRSLIKLGVGVPAVEDHFKKHANACRVTNNVRKAKLINLSMRDKLEDAVTYNCQMRTKKRKVERRIKRKLGGEVGRKVIAELDKVADASKQVLFEKNIKKEKHLKEKFLLTKKSSPGGRILISS